MESGSSHEISRLLRSWGEGDASALDALMPLVYDELHQLAHSYMRHEGRGHILQTPAVIHEVFLRLVRSRAVNWEDRTHFFGICARLMRQILVDFARSERAQKRGGDVTRVELENAPEISTEQDTDLLALDEALTSLSRLDERRGRIVELRFSRCRILHLCYRRGWRYSAASGNGPAWRQLALLVPGRPVHLFRHGGRWRLADLSGGRNGRESDSGHAGSGQARPATRVA